MTRSPQHRAAAHVLGPGGDGDEMYFERDGYLGVCYADGCEEFYSELSKANPRRAGAREAEAAASPVFEDSCGTIARATGSLTSYACTLPTRHDGPHGVQVRPEWPPYLRWLVPALVATKVVISQEMTKEATTAIVASEELF